METVARPDSLTHTLETMTAHPTEEVPDRIYAPAGRDMHSRYIYNFRDDVDAAQCVCNDAASWPEPKAAHALTETDDLESVFTGIRRRDEPGISGATVVVTVDP